MPFCYAVPDILNSAGFGGVCLNAIKRKNFIRAALAGFDILTGVMLLVFGGAISEIQAQIFREHWECRRCLQAYRKLFTRINRLR